MDFNDIFSSNIGFMSPLISICPSHFY